MKHDDCMVRFIFTLDCLAKAVIIGLPVERSQEAVPRTIAAVLRCDERLPAVSHTVSPRKKPL